MATLRRVANSPVLWAGSSVKQRRSNESDLSLGLRDHILLGTTDICTDNYYINYTVEDPRGNLQREDLDYTLGVEGGDRKGFGIR